MSDIKIFVSCHKPSIILKNKLIYPIQVGTALSNNRFDNMLHDDEGENISSKNKMYCELTAQYYAWKNVDADYYRFFHYRRYLSFSNKKYKETIQGIPYKKLDEEAVNKFALDEKSMQEIIENYDVTTVKRGIAINVYAQYCLALTQSKTDIDFCLDYIKNHYPEVYPTAKKVVRSSKSYFCNMFIMKKDIFQKYCSWLFEILEAHEKAMHLDHYDVQSYRVSGYLAERLCSIYLHYLKEQKNLRFKELQSIFFKETDDSKEIIPQTNDACSVLLNIDKNNFLNSTVLIQSIINNANKENNYYLILNNINLKYYQKNYLSRLQLPKNIKIKVIQEKSLIKLNYSDIISKFNNLNKLIYIKSNCVVNADINELYNLDINADIAGTRDLNKIIKFGKTKLKKQYDKLQKDNIFDCIQSDVLVLNIESIKQHFNSNLKSQLIPFDWNVIIDEKFKVTEKVYAFAPHYIYYEYIKALKNPKILNFNGKYVPLNNPLVEKGNIYWENARNSPIYEVLQFQSYLHFKNIQENLYDKMFPNGTTRRLLIKTYIKKY